MASFPSSGIGGAGVSPAPSSPLSLPARAGNGEGGTPAWVALAQLHPAFASRARRDNAALAWCQSLPAAQRRKPAGRWQVAREARLPDNRTVEAVLHAGQHAALNGLTLPPGHERWSDRDRRRFLDSHELLRLFAATRAELLSGTGHGGTGVSPVNLDALACALVRERHAEWLRGAGLRCTRSTLYSVRRRLDPASPSFDGNLDRRGRPCHSSRDRERTGSARMSPAAEQLFRSLYLSPNQLCVADCWRYVRGEAAAHGWTWPGLRHVQRWVTQAIDRGARVLARKGPKRFAADCQPKIERSLDDVLAGDAWVLDGRKLDLMARVPCRRAGWRRARLVLTGVMDVRSRLLVGWDIAATENSDGILRGVRQALLDWGAPLEATIDNGEAYKAALGVSLDAENVGNIFAALGVTVHRALAYSAWSKPIEPRWRVLKDGFDRWCLSFWGGSAAERPHDVQDWSRRRVDLLPTLDQVREQFALFLREAHAREITGSGTLGLTPNLIAEQFRGQVRRVDAALVDALCGRTTRELTVGRDGVSWQGIGYLPEPEQLARLQGQRVRLRLDPARADRVGICSLAGRLLCWAVARRLRGATREQLREAQRETARYKRIIREQLPARDYLLHTPAHQVLATKAAHAAARESELRAALPPPPDPTVTIVRADVLHPTRDRERAGTVRAACERDSNRVRTGFEVLADRLQPLRPAPPALDPFAILAALPDNGTPLPRGEDRLEGGLDPFATLVAEAG